MNTSESKPAAGTHRLDGQVAIVTGGAQGIGRAIAGLFVGEGAKVVLCDVDGPLAEQSAKELSAGGGECLGLPVNVTSFEDCERLVKTAIEKFGRIDVVVNNAGITKDNLLMRMSDADWDAVLGVNLKGAFNITKAAIRTMFKAHKGSIINIASVVGQMGNVGQANYSASKAGLIGLTKACAKEFSSRNVRVNCVAPGFVKTRMTDAIPEEYRKKMIESILLGRMGEPLDIAKAVLFLASEDSAYVTGHVLAVNGGLYM